MTPRTRGIVPVHLLGNPCPMVEIMALARRRGLAVIEDCCEAHGAKVGSRLVGSFGDLGTFSFFFSHHITTMEGGMITARRRALLPILVSQRAHGWIRGRSDERALRRRHADIDPRFLFVTSGFNVRPHRAERRGLHPFPRLEAFIAARRRNHRGGSARWNRSRTCSIQRERRDPPRAFGFSMVIRRRAVRAGGDDALSRARGVETRPIASSNMARPWPAPLAVACGRAVCRGRSRPRTACSSATTDVTPFARALREGCPRVRRSPGRPPGVAPASIPRTVRPSGTARRSAHEAMDRGASHADVHDGFTPWNACNDQDSERLRVRAVGGFRLRSLLRGGDEEERPPTTTSATPAQAGTVTCSFSFTDSSVGPSGVMVSLVLNPRYAERLPG